MRRNTIVTVIAVSLLLGLIAAPAIAAYGDLDPTFADLGIHRIDAGGNERVADLWVDTDGRVLVTGSTDTSAFVIALTAQGTPDLAFTEGGTLEIEPDDLAVDSIEGAGVARTEDEKVIVAGIVEYDSMGTTMDSIWINRRHFDGLTDETFGNVGHRVVDLGDGEEIHSLALAPDGSIFVVGTAVIDAAMGSEATGYALHLTPDGDLDPAFGDDGIVLFDSLGAGTGTPSALDRDGRVVIGTTVLTPTMTSALDVIRLLPDGSVDAGFDPPGLELTGLEVALGLHVTTDGRVTVTGSQSDVIAPVATWILRLTADGDFDRSLRGVGWAFLEPGERPAGLAVDDVGRTVVIANGSPPHLTRLRTNGLVDETLDSPIELDDADVEDAAMPDGETVVTAGTFSGLTAGDVFVTRHDVVPPAPSFVDDDGSVFEGDIEAIAAAGITLGCDDQGNYCPDDPVTRGQMAAFLVRGIGYLEGAGADLFADDDGSVFEADIDRLARAGVTLGCDDQGNYCPDDPVTRGQMAAFLVRALGYSEGAGDDLFLDDDGSIFETEIDRLARAGVTQGCDTERNYCPDDPVTRGQMAAFLNRALGLSN